MSENSCTNFNVDQIMPILTDLDTAKNIIKNMIDSLTDYQDTINELIGEFREAELITDEMKAKVDKNVLAIINDLSLNINASVPFKHVFTKKEKLFERLHRGLSYRYKLKNGSIVENPELLIFENLSIDSPHRVIEIGGTSFQFVDSSDCCISSSSCLSEHVPSDEETDDALECFIQKLGIEIAKLLTLKSRLYILYSCINYTIKSIVTDVKHYKLFDESILESILQI